MEGIVKERRRGTTISFGKKAGMWDMVKSDAFLATNILYIEQEDNKS